MKIGILWDLDGTLLDTLQDLVDGTNYALRHFGYPERTVEQVRSFVGNGAARLIAQAVPQGKSPEPVLQVFQDYYPNHCRIHTKPYDGICRVLKELEGKYPMAIVSNKPDTAVKALCEELFPGIYAVGEHPGCPRKPAPDMVYEAMTAIGVDTCIYVGDSEVDVLTAKNAGVPCLSVLWGFRTREEIENAGGNWFCQTPSVLPEIIEEMVGSINGQ